MKFWELFYIYYKTNKKVFFELERDLKKLVGLVSSKKDLEILNYLIESPDFSLKEDKNLFFSLGRKYKIDLISFEENYFDFETYENIIKKNLFLFENIGLKDISFDSKSFFSYDSFDNFIIVSFEDGKKDSFPEIIIEFKEGFKGKNSYLKKLKKKILKVFNENI